MEGLTIEELRARLATSEAETAAAQAKASAALAEKDAVKAEAEKLQAENKKLAATVNAVEEEKAKTAPVSFETEDGDKFEFTCPAFTWDDGRVINVREMANSKDAKEQHEFALMCGALIERESGIIRRKED